MDYTVRIVVKYLTFSKPDRADQSQDRYDARVPRLLVHLSRLVFLLVSHVHCRQSCRHYKPARVHITPSINRGHRRWYDLYETTVFHVILQDFDS